ncbi:MAG: hypothetical protein NT070_14140 [Cyanobacteria bacterium]|nr:hypothetical protein [Cyanobacteriota bacterium]
MQHSKSSAHTIAPRLSLDILAAHFNIAKIENGAMSIRFKSKTEALKFGSNRLPEADWRAFEELTYLLDINRVNLCVNDRPVGRLTFYQEAQTQN